LFVREGVLSTEQAFSSSDTVTLHRYPRYDGSSPA